MISLDAILETDPEFNCFRLTRSFRRDTVHTVVEDRMAVGIPERSRCLRGHSHRIRRELEKNR